MTTKVGLLSFSCLLLPCRGHVPPISLRPALWVQNSLQTFAEPMRKLQDPNRFEWLDDSTVARPALPVLDSYGGTDIRAGTPDGWLRISGRLPAPQAVMNDLNLRVIRALIGFHKGRRGTYWPDTTRIIPVCTWRVLVTFQARESFARYGHRYDRAKVLTSARSWLCGERLEPELERLLDDLVMSRLDTVLTTW